MSQYSLVLLDKKPPARFLSLWEDYLRRLNKWVSLKTYFLSPSMQGNDLSAAREKDFHLYSEHKAFQKKLLVILDEKGLQLSTLKVKQALESWQNQSQDIAFLIGPSYGLDKKWKHQANALWSLSQMTLPHDFAQLIFLEQFYRAYSIIKKQPYHCDH